MKDCFLVRNRNLYFQTHQMPSTFLKIGLNFQCNFRFTAKWRGKQRVSMYVPYTDPLTINIPHKDDTCVVFNETTVYLIITQSPFFEVQISLLVSCIPGVVCVICVQHQSIIQNCFTAIKFLCSSSLVIPCPTSGNRLSQSP